ncbi:PP2C family protein-serine/threonine phosphatase [Alishewanella tabrizica]|uniref:PPM-type phosphatase domain-containing protein n=1 Tax=Alishewanella tabrizica TaxID=671278 RepID=A0ABQ2WU12_9ALTE|nr:PP2C family serine/threonine-protein phosphatase [Alishewanella tabrizica]GGW73399.1 hypothetical protein GCM10008111_31750 [Alishewanella tabrizica]
MRVSQILLQASEQGGRAYNQDRLAVHVSDDNDDFLLLVADGVGGSEQGEVAADIVVEQSNIFWQKRHRYSDATSLLTDFVLACNTAVKQRAEQGIKTATTLVALLSFKGQLVSAHAGDSRLYQFSCTAKINQTKDHSLAYAKLIMGEITEQQLATHPSQSQLLNCINGDADLQIDINHWQAELGGYFVLCTDGFWEMFSDDDIVKLIAAEQRDTVFLNRLNSQLQLQPQHDNTTVIIAHLSSSIALVDDTGAKAEELAKVKPETPQSSAGSIGRKAEFIKWLAGLVLLLIAAVALAFYYLNSMDCCAKPVVSAPSAITLSDSVGGIMQEINAAQPDQAGPENAEPAQSNSEQGNQSDTTLLNDNLLSSHELELVLADGEDAITALLQKLLDEGLVARGSVLNKTAVMLDQYAEITTVQLMVNNTPVYGALLRYRKTAKGIKVIAGKTANLPLLPAAPAHDFASCFARYQQIQAKDNPVALLNSPAITLYIDAASQSYFWLTPVAVGAAAVTHDLFLSDSNCDALRIISRQVSG